MNQLYCVIDFETRSEADLKKLGTFEYSAHSSTQILCVCWKLGTRETLRTTETKFWSSGFPSSAKLGSLSELIRLVDPNIIFVAHNAFFEQSIFKNVLAIDIPISQWICTASLAAAMALPRSLEGACNALEDVSVKKDMEGRRLILKYCKPRFPSKDDPSWWPNKTNDLKRIIEYCKTDVEATTKLFLRIPPLNEKERKVWELDQLINFRGFRVDRPMVDSILGMIEEEMTSLDAETRELTNGGLNSTRQRDRVLKWLELRGEHISGLTAKEVSDYLKRDLIRPEARRLLEIRQSISKSSTKKYTALEQRSRGDGRCRDNLVYHQASTGRWAGSGVQPQNFPRNSIGDIEQGFDCLREGTLDWVKVAYPSPMEVFSSCLRSMIIPEEGKTFFCGDYASIEARVLFWIAGHEEGLKAYQEDKDLYREIASTIYGKPLRDITKAEREIGKRAILGCGYGMGHVKFKATCDLYGQSITEDRAEKAVLSYRKTHYPIPALWRSIENAAMGAVKTPTSSFSVGKTKWFMKGNFLFCELPSKRRLSFPNPEIRWEMNKWKQKQPCLYHRGVNGMTRKWECAGTYGGRLVENCVQAIARDFMVESMLLLEKEGFEIVLSVHDELLCEFPKDRESIQTLGNFKNIMSSLPEWGKDFPMKVEVWQGERWRK